MLNLKNGAKPIDVASALNAELIYCGSKAIKTAVIDSRKAGEGDLFVAIKGENTDGHLYADKAALSGCSGILVEKMPECLDTYKSCSCSVFLADDSSLALSELSKAHKNEMNALTVAVTGSVGKTTTRQYIFSVLNTKYKAHKTEGNFNNALGLPLTILQIKPEDEITVLELGMGKKGDIDFLSSLCTPDIAVITNIGSSHIEHLGSREGIAEAKLEVCNNLKKDGNLILNGDEPLLQDIDGAIYVSLNNSGSPYRAENIKFTSNGMTFDAVCPKRIIENCAIPTYGSHTVLDAMYAITIGDILNMNDTDIKKGLKQFEGVGMRQNIEVKDGIMYIHDYYNASAEAMKASLSVTKTFASERNGRAVAVLGSMLELGELSESIHRSVGEYAAKCGINILYTFGADAAYIADEAVKNGMDINDIHIFTDETDEIPIAEAIKEEIKCNDCVLIKASHGLNMGRIAKLL